MAEFGELIDAATAFLRSHQAAPARSQDPPAEIAAANQRLRDTAKWLLTSFAAVGAILVAGLQLANVGKLTADTPDARIVATIGGIAIAALGIALAIGYTGSVLAPFFTSFGTANKEPDITRHVLGDRELVGMNYAELKKAIKEADELLEQIEDERGPDSPEYKAAAVERDALEVPKQAALTMIGAELLWRRYKRARRAVIAAVFLVLAGAVAFAWGANPPEGTSSAPVTLGTPPQQLDVTLSEKGVAALKAKRGCTDATMRVLQVGGEEGRREVIAIPTPSCKPVRFVLTPGLGTAMR